MFLFSFLIIIKYGNWGLGIGDWGLGIGANLQSPIPNPHTKKIFFFYLKNKFSKKNLLNFILYFNKKK